MGGTWPRGSSDPRGGKRLSSREPRSSAHSRCRHDRTTGTGRGRCCPSRRSSATRSSWALRCCTTSTGESPSVEREGEIGVRLTGWLTVGLVLGASHGLVVAVTGDAEWQLAGARWPRRDPAGGPVGSLRPGAGGRAGGRARATPRCWAARPRSLLVAGSSLVLKLAHALGVRPRDPRLHLRRGDPGCDGADLDPPAPPHRRPAGTPAAGRRRGAADGGRDSRPPSTTRRSSSPPPPSRLRWPRRWWCAP